MDYPHLVFTNDTYIYTGANDAARVASNVTSPASTCPVHASTTTNVGNCSIKTTVWDCLEHFHMKWKAQATETHSGVAGPTDSWFDSKSGAGTHAIMSLVNTKLVHTTPDSKDYCNCGHTDSKVNAKCTIRSTICGMFNNSNDVATGAISYHAWSTNLVTGHVGEVTEYASPVNAATAALMALVKKYPADGTACGGGL